MGGGSGGGGRAGRKGGGGDGGSSINVAEMTKGTTEAKVTGSLPADTKEVGVRVTGYLSPKEREYVQREGFKFDREHKEWFDPNTWSPKGITEGIKGSRLRFLGKSTTIDFRKVA